jgi:hypothetical protein
MNNTLFQWEQQGQPRTMQQDGTAPEGACQPPQAEIVLMGSGITDGRGEWTLTVPRALCSNLQAVDWVSLVATPSRFYNWSPATAPLPPPFPPLQPEYVTAAWSRENQLTLYVKSWQPNGENQGEVPFSWHAVVLQHLE